MSSTRTVKFAERAPFSGAGFRLDKENGVAVGVAVCGFVSANGRDYPKAVLARDHKVYEGANVFCDHKDGERSVHEWFGTLKNVRLRDDGKPIADLKYSRSHPFAAQFEERAENHPASFGLSHVAVCQTSRVNGREVIEAITRVESVDLVARPATNASLFESERTPMKLTEYVEALKAKFPADPRLPLFAEMDGMTGDMPADAPPVDSADAADDPVKAAFKAAMHGLVEQFDGGGLSGEDLVKKLKTLVKTAEKMAGVKDDADAAAESLKAQIDALTKENTALMGELTEAIIGKDKLTAVQRKALDLLPDAAEKRALMESYRAASDRPQSAGAQAVRDAGTAVAKESKPAAVPETADDFRKWITE